MWSSNRKRYCVFGCTVLGVYMHNFPHPERKSELFKKWVSVVGDKLKETDPWRIYKNKKICDHHFTTEQKVACHRLMNNAVPSVNLNGPFAVSSYTQIEHNYCLPGTYTSSFSQQSSAKVVMDEALHSRLNTHDQPSTSQAYVDKDVKSSEFFLKELKTAKTEIRKLKSRLRKSKKKEKNFENRLAAAQKLVMSQLSPQIIGYV